MAASGILLCGIAEAVRPEVDLSVGVPADKVVIADGILDQETQNNTDESFCDRLMKKMVHPIHMASRFLNGLGADSEEYVPSETEYNLMALRTEESAVDLLICLIHWRHLSLFHGINLQNDFEVWGQKIPGARRCTKRLERGMHSGYRRSTGGSRRHRLQLPRKWGCQLRRYSAAMIPPIQSITRRTRRAG